MECPFSRWGPSRFQWYWGRSDSWANKWSRGWLFEFDQHMLPCPPPPSSKLWHQISLFFPLFLLNLFQADTHPLLSCWAQSSSQGSDSSFCSPIYPSPLNPSLFFWSQRQPHPAQGTHQVGEDGRLAGFPSEAPTSTGRSQELESGGSHTPRAGPCLTLLLGFTAPMHSPPIPYFKLTSSLRKQDTLWKLSIYPIRSDL